MTNDDVACAYGLCVPSLARELGSITVACRPYGIHCLTYCRWKHAVERFGAPAPR
jgi:hypothetical protein